MSLDPSCRMETPLTNDMSQSGLFNSYTEYQTGASTIEHDYVYLSAVFYYYASPYVGPDGSQPVYEASFQTQQGSIYVQTPIGKLVHTQTGGNQTTTLDSAEAYSQLQNMTWPTPPALASGGGASAGYQFSPDQATASKLAYQIQFRPGLPLVLWQETFTPTGASAPTDIRWMSYTPANPQENVTPQYLIDPFDTSNPHRFGNTPGQYNVVQFDVSAGLAVDANRDGQIRLASQDASDATSATTPFRFWLNDDVDRYHQDPGYSDLEFDDIDPAEITSQGWKLDWTYDQITSLRDLEDFSRFWISLHGIANAVRNGQLYIGLRWSNTTGDPWIKLYPHVETDGGTKYLFDSSPAGVPLTQQTTTNAIADLRTQSAVTIVAPEDGTFVLPTSLFASLTESTPVTHLLFEGCQAGTGQLQIVVLKKDGTNYTEIGQGPGVWLDLKEPHEFIQRWSSGDEDRAPPQAWVTLNANSGTFAPPATDEEKNLVLYVHGYNMNGGADLAGDKQRWIETTYKRLWHLGYKGRVGGFSWPCAIQGGFTDNKGFDDSEQRAWQSGTYLMLLLRTLKTAGYRVHLLAHSQGNVVAGEALSLWRALGNTTPLISTYVASQGAIPAHCYDATLPSRTDFTPSVPNIYGHYWTSSDSATLPALWNTSNPSYLSTNYVRNAAGRFANFYNPDDYALTGNGLTGSEHSGWMVDQRLKPDVTYGYTVNDGFLPGPLRFPDDRYQIFSYAAPAWSLALGATATGGVFNQNAVNLKTNFTFGAEHLWHSGEFRSYNAARYHYWMSLLDAALIPHLNP